MDNQNFQQTLLLDESPTKVFAAIRNVRGWWSKEIDGESSELGDEFSYHYKDVHRCRMKLVEVIPGQKIVWEVLNNYFSFTTDKSEWIGDKVVFELSKPGDKTQLVFTHFGLVPTYECYGACVNGWSQYIGQSLPSLIRTGKGQPNSSERARTTHEVAARFNELAQQEKWFDIQDELFAEDVKSVEPIRSQWFSSAEGKAAVRKKGEAFVSRVEVVHHAFTSVPVIGSNHFAVGRETDLTVTGFGRIQLNEVMLYEISNGKVISEQFFY